MPHHSLRHDSVAPATRLKFATRVALLSAAALFAPAAHATFAITLTFGSGLSASQQAAAQSAADYWNATLSGYKSGVALTGFNIQVDAVNIPSSYLANADPTGTSIVSGTRYTTAGHSNINLAYYGTGTTYGGVNELTDVMTHEFGHTLGIGTLWTGTNALYVKGSYQYTGINALNAWKDEFSQASATFVPVEAGGGDGTADSHWNENDGGGGTTGFVSKYTGRDFRYELMTGWADTPTFTGAVTLGSLVDMGYTIAVPRDGSGNYLLSVGRVFTGLDDSAGSRSMRKITGDIVTLTAAGMMTGGSSIEAGTLVLEHGQALGTGPVSVAGGTLEIGAVNVTGIGALTLASGAITGSTGTITATSYAMQSGTASATLAGAGIALTKTTAGTVTLSGANTYTGATAVNAGALIVSGSLANTAITVASGATFGGKGTIGTAGGASLTINSGGILLGDTTGALTLNGALTVGTGARIDLVNTPTTGTEYTILNYTGAGTGLTNFSTLFRGSVNTGTAGAVKVTATATVPLNWAGTTDSNWGIVDAKNNFTRVTGGAADNFFQGDAVTFGDAPAAKTLTLNGRIQAGAITVSNTSGTYTFGGTGELAGTTGLTKTGAGTLIISGAHTFTGKTALNGGITQIASDAGLGAAPGAVVADQLTLGGGTLRAGAALTLAANRGITVGAASTLDTQGFNVTAAGVLAGTGALTKTGTGTLTLTGANTITGNVLASAGTLKISNISGTGFTALEVGTAGKLVINDSSGTASDVHNITVHGAGVASTNGFAIAAGENFSLTGTLALDTAATTIRTDGAGTATLATNHQKYVAGDSGVYPTISMITVAPASSGSVIDSSVSFGGPSGYSNNFGQTIAVNSGAATATGDLRIDGALRQGTNPASVTFQTMGTGSVALTADSTAFTATTIDVRDTSTLMVTGTGRLGGGTHSGNIYLAQTGGTFKWASSANQTLSGNLLNSTTTGAVGGKLVMAGTGTLTLTGANTFTGGTTVSAGKLMVNNTTGSGLGATGAVGVTGAGTTLGGSGSYTAGLTTIGSGAILQGGDGTTGTTLTIGSGVTLASGSVVQLALGAAGAHSTLARTGGGTWTFAANESFNFIDLGATAGTYSGLITGLAVDPNVAGWTLANSGWTGTFSYAANTVSLTLIAIPEPATYGLLGAASLAALALVRRRRR